MIGILLVTHRQLGEAFIDACEFILGKKPEAVEWVSINMNEEVEKLRKKIEHGIKSVDAKKGVLIFTDMFGGTPSNLSYSFLEDNRVEVISGVNLPILIKAINSREDMKLSELSECLERYGKKSITLASSILKGVKKD